MRVTVSKKLRRVGLRVSREYSVNRDGVSLITVSPCNGGWYWYGLDNNTLWGRKPFSTYTEAIADAKAAIKAAK